ncbi:hypothetical protein [Rhizobium hainanense]|uniref:hypothetical protein n=1 Tax=Rhizobium hainanense TaxID=52131 RepID=UPI0013564A7E|nr:hypothetical protein [Rhizobium hainanense]
MSSGSASLFKDQLISIYRNLSSLMPHEVLHIVQSTMQLVTFRVARVSKVN